MIHTEEKAKSNVERDELSDIASSSPSDSSIERTGTVWTAVAHIINGVIGSGVLSLAWSVAQLGWIGGPLCILVFGIITIISSNLICDCYRYPHPELGQVRNRSYAKAVRSYLGKKNMYVIGVFIYESFYGFAIAFTITAAHSMRKIDAESSVGILQVLLCSVGLMINTFPVSKWHLLVHYPIILAIIRHDALCKFGETKFMLLYGAVQLLVAQIPDLHAADFLSMIAAAMSFAYASIGLGLGVAKTIGNGHVKGDLRGISGVTTPQKVWLSFQAIGDIAFSFTYNIIILDIQDTLKEPKENRKMKKAVNIAITITSTFFLCCGCFGYAAFGNQAPGNLLTGFGFYEPYWLVDFANACIILHLIGGYPLYSQPLFAAVERKLKKINPDSNFVNKEYTVKLPLVACLRVNLLRLCFRSAYVISTTALAIIFPYFNEVLGVLGALNFWPVMIYFPVQMYLKQREVTSWTPIWIFLQALKVLGLVISIVAMVGSVEGLIRSKFS